MFTNNFKLSGIDEILSDIGYMSEEQDEEKAGEKYEGKYKKTGKKSKDYDDDGTVEDEADEYAGVKDKAIKNAKEKKDTEKEVKESFDFSSILDDISDAELDLLTDELIEEVVEEVFSQFMIEGLEIDEVEGILVESLDEAAKQLNLFDYGKQKARQEKIAKVKGAVKNVGAKLKAGLKSVASGAKKVAVKTAGAAGEVAGAAVAGYKKASAAGGSSSDSEDDSSSGSSRPSMKTATATKKGPSTLSRIGSALKAGLKKAVGKTARVAAKVGDKVATRLGEDLVQSYRSIYEEKETEKEEGEDSEDTENVNEGKEELKQRNKNEMQRKAGNLGREVVSSNKGPKRTAAMDRMGKLVKVIARDDEQKRFKTLGQSPAHNSNYKEEYVDESSKTDDTTRRLIKQYAGKKGISFEPGPRWDPSANRGKGANLSPKQVEKQRRKSLRQEELELDENRAMARDPEGRKSGYSKQPDPSKAGFTGVGNMSIAQIAKMSARIEKEKKAKNESFDQYDDLIDDMISEGYEEEQIIEVITALEEGYEVIFEEDGAFIKDGVEELDEEFLSDVEMVADWLHAEGVIENEDDYFQLMEELSEEEIDELYELVLEATAMAKRGHDETAIRNKIAKNTGGGKSADRATALEKQPTYGDANKEKQRQNYARAQRGAHRTTASSSPGLRGYGHQSSDPAVKAKQAARGAQRGSAALTPNEKKQLNMGYEMIGDSLDNGGLQVRTYSWKEVMESQEARNNPEKYEREQKKKSAPVRGEKTPMPPRGDKRREDFEKWYAANVR